MHPRVEAVYLIWLAARLQAGELSEFALNSCLDAAVRASNAQYDAPDVVERLRVRLPRGSAFETGAQAIQASILVNRQVW